MRKSRGFIELLKLELEDLKEFLRGLPLDIPISRVGDFGCEWGVTTLGLMIALNATECVGIDTFTGKDLSPTLERAQKRLDDAKAKVLAMQENSQEESLVREIQRLLRKERFPLLQQDDIVQSKKLPKNLEFVFCKLVLGNIYEGVYGNSLKGDQAVELAIRNIEESTKQGGIVCIVERSAVNAVNFSTFLEAYLSYLRICHIRRRDIGTNGRTSLSTNYIVYAYRKP